MRLFRCWRHHIIITRGLVNLYGLAVKVFVSKQFGGALEVEDGEELLAVLFIQPRATADDLLEQRHGLDVLVQHHQLAGLGIDPRAHELAGDGNHGVCAVGVDKVVQLALAHFVVARDLHHVFAAGGANVFVGLGQGHCHALGVVNVFTKDNGFGVAICALEVLGNFVGHHAVTQAQHQVAVHVSSGVNAVFNRVARIVQHAFGRAPAKGVAVQIDAHDFVGGQKAVFNALLEGVGIDRFAKVVDVGCLFGFFGCGGQADLGGTAEVVQDVAPSRVFVGTAPVALVNDDEIKKIGAELPKDIIGTGFAAALAGNGLVQAQVHLIRFIDLFAARVLGATGDGQLQRIHRRGAIGINALNALGVGAELGHGALEGFEVAHHGLVHQNVAVGQKEDAFFGTAFEQAPDDLEGGISFARACGHDQQHAVLASGNGFERAVDGVQLVVAGDAVAIALVVGEGIGLFLLGCPLLPGAITLP